MYNLLSSTLLSESKKDVTDLNNKVKRQKWWSPVLNNTHIEVCLAYRAYKNSNFNENFKRRFHYVKKLF